MCNIHHKQYNYIRAYHERNGSTPHFINHLIQLAQSENAPLLSIYRGRSGNWVTLSVLDAYICRALHSRVDALNELTSQLECTPC